MAASKKTPQILQTASRAASHLLKSIKPKSKSSAATENVATSAHKNPPKGLKLSDIAFNSSIYSAAKDIEDVSSRGYTEITSLLCEEKIYDNQETSTNTLEPPWISSTSNNKLSHCQKETSRERKQKHVYKNNQTGRFDQLVKTCGNRLGLGETLKMLGRIGRETGTQESKAILALWMQKSIETDDHEVQVELNLEAYQIFQSMKETGVPIEEEIYGPFLKYLTDADMVQDFYSFSDFFKQENPASLPRLAYYEMRLCIRLNDEDKIKQLLSDYSLYDGEDKQSFQESYLLALCGSDRRRDFLMLLETFDATKASTEKRLSDIFKSLGKLSLESYAEKFLLELKTSGAESATLTNYIYDYSMNFPNLAVEDAVSKFKQFHSELEMKPTLLTHYEKLIRDYCKSLKVQEAIDLANEMFNLGATSSPETIHAMLDACMESCQYNMVHQIYSMIRRQGLKLDVETFDSLISLTVRMKDFSGAYDMITDMVELDLKPTTSIYNSILAGYYREKNIHRVKAVLKQMEQSDVKPDSYTYSYLICNSNSEEEIIKFCDELKHSGLKITKHVNMALMNAYAACGKFEKAKQVILDDNKHANNNEMKSVLVSALASHGQLSDALTIYEEIKQSEGSLAPKAAISLIEHLDSEGQQDRLIQVLEEMKESDYWIQGCNRVLKYCMRHNHLSSAVDLLKKIRDKFAVDEVATESIFDELFKDFVDQKPKDMKFGLELLLAIKEEMGLRPSRNVLDFLLDACVCANDLKTAYFIWKEYKMAGLTYNVLSFLRMYRTLLALGDSKSAEEILKRIPQDDRHISYVTKGFQDTYSKAALPKRIKKKEKKSKKKSKAAKACWSPN